MQDHGDVARKVGQYLGQKAAGQDDVGVDLYVSGIGIVHDDFVHDIGFGVLLFMKLVVLA